jgi:AmiR/NasT family two-component response regulator
VASAPSPDPYGRIRDLVADRHLLGVATGILMHSRNCSAEEAEEILADDAEFQGIEVLVLAGYISEARFG